MASNAKININKDSKALGQFANLPSAFKNPSKTAITKDSALHKLQGLKPAPVRQLQEAASMLAQVNRYNIKHEKRVEIVKAILAFVYSTMAKYYRQYQSRVLSLPESRERRDIILACVSISEQASIAYKHYFKEIYSAKTTTHRKVREQVVRTGVRILELLRIQQRFMALRHQKLPPSNWQDVNRVFFSLLLHDDVDDVVTLHGHIGTWVKKSDSVQPTSHASAKQIYISIQIFGLLDAQSWSTRLFHVPDAYLNYIDDAVRIYSDSNLQLQPGWLVTHIDRMGPPLFQREQHMAEPRILFEYSNLYNRLVVDYEELAKMKFIGSFDAEKLSRPLLDIEQIERFPLLESMLFGLRPRERKQKRHAAFGHEQLTINFGFRDSFDKLIEFAVDEVKRLARTQAFRDNLSNIATMANIELGEASANKWEIVNFSSGGILVFTRESVTTNPIQIGQIVSFIPNEDLKRPMLGYVSRINRPNEQQVEVAIVRFSSHSESAIVYSDQLKGGTGKEGAGVILFKTMDDKWCLVARHEYDFVPGSPIRLLREDSRTIPARLGHVMLTKQEFVVFELSAPGM